MELKSGKLPRRGMRGEQKASVKVLVIIVPHVFTALTKMVARRSIIKKKVWKYDFYAE